MLSPDQKKAAMWAIMEDSQCVMITGEGGTGKSHIIAYLYKKYRCDVAVYTHAAKNRLKNDGVNNCTTIHSLMNIQPKMNLQATSADDLVLENERSADFRGGEMLLLDECSMVPKWMFEKLKEKYDKIIAFGDVVQLPPVQGKAVKWHKLPTYELTYNWRTDNPELLEKIRKCRNNPDISHFDKIDLDTLEKHLKKDIKIIAYSNRTVQAMNDRFGKYGNALITHKHTVRYGGAEITNGELITDHEFIDMIDKEERLKQEIYLGNSCLLPREVKRGDSRYSMVKYIKVEGELVYECVTSVEDWERLVDIATEDWREFRKKYKLDPEDCKYEYEAFLTDFEGSEREVVNKFITMRYNEVKAKLNAPFLEQGLTPPSIREWANFIALSNTLIVTPAVAVTAHKAQGQTFERVVVVPDNKGIGHKKKLTYVAVSRAKKKVWMLK